MKWCLVAECSHSLSSECLKKYFVSRWEKSKLRKTALFVPFGSGSGKRLQSLGLRAGLWPPAEWLSSQASIPDLSARLPGSPAPAWGRRDGRGLRGGTCFGYQTERSASSMRTAKRKTKLSSTSPRLVRDLFPPVLFCAFLKMSSGTNPKSGGRKEPRAPPAEAVPWERLSPSLLFSPGTCHWGTPWAFQWNAVSASYALLWILGLDIWIGAVLMHDGADNLFIVFVDISWMCCFITVPVARMKYLQRWDPFSRPLW